MPRQGERPEAAEGANKSTPSAQATSSVRTTERGWQTFLRAIAEKAINNQHHRFGDLYRWLNQDVLRLSFLRLRKDAASGVDGVTFQEYEKNLEANLADLVGRLKRKAYRARLVRRKHIPKGPGKLRPLGIPVLEDKLLQMAVTQILLAIYEVDFLPCSYGYRPGVGAHDAIQDLSQELQFGGHHFVVEADIKGFLDRSSYYTLVHGVVEKSCGCWSKTRILRPFWRPRDTWITESSPRFTRCMIVCRDTPRIRIASGMAT
jgi:retron-type reverse transcriptase